VSAFDTYITDLDGTLCNTLEANIAAYGLAFADAGLKFDESAYRDNFGHRFDEMMQAIAPAATTEQRLFIADRKARHYKKQASLVLINEHLVDVLRHAKSNSIKVGLATTAKRRNALAVLQYFGLEELFDVMIFGEDVTHSKPHPECYQLAIQHLGAQPSNVLIFEDSLVGLEAARNSGAHVLKIAI